MAFTYTSLQRFGWGPHDEHGLQKHRIPRNWLRSQLATPEMAALSGTFDHSDTIAQRIIELRGKSSPEQRKKINAELTAIYATEMQARFSHSLRTPAPFIDRLVHFWSNHFTVSYSAKSYLKGIVGAFEREVIRPHVLGKFSDMLIAATSHPAMLIYLDNHLSIGPNSPVGKRTGKGLNENLAREILELHTLGVDGGYTQDDVIALAKIITGWSMTPPKEGGGGFAYNDRMHEPGSHTLLDETYRQKAKEQGIAALQNLAHHPSTAHFIATKLARHFISDTPSKHSIRKLELTFLRTGGDLMAIAETLIDMAEISNHHFTKIKTPYELIVSSLRLVGYNPKQSPFKHIMHSLTLMEHTPFKAPSPAGWPDTGEAWLSPNALLNRVQWCYALAQRSTITNNPLMLAQQQFGRFASAQTLRWIEGAPTGTDGLALLLSSPEWQRR